MYVGAYVRSKEKRGEALFELRGALPRLSWADRCTGSSPDAVQASAVPIPPDGTGRAGQAKVHSRNQTQSI